ncbi:MAG: cytochrome c3 family protein [Anaerolineales bacterium]|nr:cytochrome c3 family protein [Anaerolineales bacterium]
MRPGKHVILTLTFLLLMLAACSEPEQVQVTRVVRVPGETVEVTRVVEVEVVVEPTATATPTSTELGEMLVEGIPYQQQWATSAHANADAEAFRHWDEEDPAEVPVQCAKCHSALGYLDFLGADGSTPNVVDVASPLGTVIECAACHNSAAMEKTSVLFPSGIEVMGLGDEARCMECHQGRASKETVDTSIADAGLTTDDLDVVSEDLGFTNIHYYAAAATQYGNIAMGGYEYDGKSYDARFDHVAPYDTCVGCHDAHTLELKLDDCSSCHGSLNTPEDLLNVRFLGSLVDYDGDGNIEEGIYFEIETMRENLYAAMQAYAAEISGAALVYDEATYPYFFADANSNGSVDEGEGRYNAWTARLAKAAYNYQVSLKDPGRYAHGGKYVIQLLYDSLEDVNMALSTPIDMTGMHRIDHGHFAGSEEAFRHWDEDGFVSASCAKCHSDMGLPFFLAEGVSVSQEPSNGLNCATCHDNVTTFSRYVVEEVAFPSGAVLSMNDLDSNLCIECHQGRESTSSVDARIGDLAPDDPTGGLRFVNVHYFAAGATLLGTEAKGVYEYPGQTYFGRNEHVEQFDTCIECHDSHAQEVVVEVCGICHGNVDTAEDLPNIRFNEEGVYIDWDGDGNLTEGIHDEIATMSDVLYATMQAYAANTEGVDSIVYNAGRYPYFFIDANGDGQLGADEGDGYTTWTPRLLRAAYNYQYVLKDPGAYAHNGKYVVQVLYDTLVDMGADVTGMSRPELPAEPAP